MQQRFFGALTGALLLTAASGQPAAPAQPTTAPTTAIAADLKALLANGPRVPGTPASDAARAYLESEFRKAGYQTRREAFDYERFQDLGSDVQVGGRMLPGFALQGSGAGEVSAGVARVSGVGTPQDFASANVRGKIAVVARGTLPFAQKASNALTAGAAGLIVVNNEDGDLRGTLGENVKLPVLGVDRVTGDLLRGGEQATLNLRGERREVRGQNVVAFKAGLTKPEALFGGHMDSVPLAPGANDNASGTAAVLDLARRAVNTPLGANSFFVLFDGEEDGLRGSRAFVEGHPDLTKSLKLMLNFDMVGVNVMPLAVGGDQNLTARAQKVVPKLQSFRDGGGSDHASFLAAGVPSLFFHRGIDPNYHRPGDTVADPALISEAVESGLKIAAALLGDNAAQ